MRQVEECNPRPQPEPCVTAVELGVITILQIPLSAFHCEITKPSAVVVVTEVTGAKVVGKGRTLPVRSELRI